MTIEQAIPIYFVGLVSFGVVLNPIMITIAVPICLSCINVIASAEVAEGRWSGVHVE